MGDEFNRPQDGFRFTFLGMKVNARPDALPPGKYPIAVNVRSYEDGTIQTRPGQPTKFTIGTNAVTDIRAYAALFTDNLPRILARDALDNIWLDNGVQVGTLAGGGASPGAAVIPFRPGASPQPWMYIANGSDYQKFSSPAANVVTQNKVGIAEPQAAPDASLAGFDQIFFASVSPGWVNGGTAGPTSNGVRLADTCGTVLPDPAPNPTPAATNSVQVGSTVNYQKLMPLAIRGNSLIVQDVFPPLLAVLKISAIQYFTGATGRCIVVPANLGAGPGAAGQSIYTQNYLATLRRGALIKIGAEVCFVWSVTSGPDGTVAIETSTVNPHTTADTLTGVPAIQVFNGFPVAGNSISALDVTYQVTVGVGTQTTPNFAGYNPFVSLGISLQQEDYITIGVLVDNLANLNEMKFLIDVGDGSFTQNFYYYTVRPSDITTAVANTATQLANAQTVSQRTLIDEEIANASNNQLQTFSSAQLPPGSGQWAQIVFPISDLTRVGNDQTKSLQTISKIQFLWNASGTINVATSDMFLFGGQQVDVGDVGTPYLYRVRPRSSVTGVVGNPSPETRYGVNPRRTAIFVALPSAAYDPQIDTWDVYRYGGTVTEWRFIGSTPSSNQFFLDNFTDDAAQAGDALDFDNFEPWPTIGLPNSGTTLFVAGTILFIHRNPISPMDIILRYLPGTLIQLGGQSVFTLRNRPIRSGNSYLLELVESAGASSGATYLIQEPNIANQDLPYMWGPDATGTVFACGDGFRPGTVYFAKNYAPDSAPDSYNIEISPPSEPLLGGETIDGLAFAASSERWWALYPQQANAAQRYAVIQQPFLRGLAAPYGHCTDGQSLYWWAKDGIWSSTQGSLTDEDLHTLFPHEGVLGDAFTYQGVTISPPDYSKAGGFRLAYANYHLYAIYQDSLGAYHTLVCDLRRKAWSVDVDGVTPQAITVVYHPEQQAGTLQSGTIRYDEVLMGTTALAGANATVRKQQDFTDDGANSPIACTIATNEFDGGDVRAPKQWGDFFVDYVPASVNGVTFTPMSLGVNLSAPLQPSPVGTPTRIRIPVSIGGVVVSDFQGLFIQWTDDFTAQTIPTQLFIWQPSFTVQPAYTIGWVTFGSSFGASGYLHIREIMMAYVSTASITLTITVFDGQSPAAIVLPSTGGAYKKTLFPLTANKGVLYNFKAASAAKFQLFLADSEFRVGPWGRSSPYAISRNMGDKSVAEAVI